MIKIQVYIAILGSLTSINLYANSLVADWSVDAKLPGEIKCVDFHKKQVCFSSGNRKNIFNAANKELVKLVRSGSRHALSYPVEITRMALPKEAMESYFNSDDSSPLRKFVYKIAKFLTKFNNFNDVFIWLGLHDYPVSTLEEGPNLIADMGELERYPMGTTVFKKNGHETVTFSCAACHSSNLFGVKIMGLTNRFPNANHVFRIGKKALALTPAPLYKLLANPSDEDYKTFKELKSAMKYVITIEPQILGLDTSLAQVGLSLASRGNDEYAELKPQNWRRRRELRKHPLNNQPADSKPAVWWNLKYKTKFLADGSIIAGNPIHTNFLWNEIGRGVDLHKLENWLSKNKKKVNELTAYTFNTEAPSYNDFFPSQIDIAKAKRGQKLFDKQCISCHGIYEKNWDDGQDLDYTTLIANKKVWYPSQSTSINVNTDPYRKDGIKYFYKDLNKLKISKAIKTIVSPQVGYIAPPLIGIWARWPYFHNNSVPTLYDVLTPENKRPKIYIAVDAIDRKLDFDNQKNGYPTPNLIRKEYRDQPKYLYDTRRKGMSNKGHSKILFKHNGEEKFTHENKLELIEYLKTL